MFRPENVQALAGLAVTLGLCWLVSENRKRFPWVLAIGAIIVQLGWCCCCSACLKPRP
jgi:CNT family concentrative nucleoside transporter